MNDLELGLRQAALRDGSRALSLLLNEIPDFYEEDLSCNICSGSMHNLGKREKLITSLLGEGTLNRSYFVCDDKSCGGHRFPKDEFLDIRRTSFSPGIRRLMAKVGSSEPFDKGRIDIQEYSGV